MRIALINMQKTKKGGLERFAKKMYDFLSEKGWTVSWLHTGCFHLPKTRLRKKIAFNTACERFVQKHGFDAVLSLEKGMLSATHVRLGEGVHHAYLQQRLEFAPIWKKLQLKCSRFHRYALATEKNMFASEHLRKVFCNSSMVKKQVIDRYNLSPEKVHVVHNSIDWHSYAPFFSRWQEEKKALLEKYRLPLDFHFVFVGNGFFRKGLLHFLKAFALLNEGHLSVIGTCKTYKQCLHFVKKRGLEKRVRFFGAQDPMPFYQLADCLVIPSLYDPFANVTLEGLAMGLQVLSSSTNGGSEILDPSSIIKNITDYDAFATILQKACKTPKTEESAKQQRKSVQSYDDARKLKEIVENIAPV